MAVYYFNGSPIVAPLTIESETAIESSDLASLRRLQLGTSAQRWKMSFFVGPTANIKDIFKSGLLAFTSSGAERYTVDLPQPNDFLTDLNNLGNTAITSSDTVVLSISNDIDTGNETTPNNAVTFTVENQIETTTTTSRNYVPASYIGDSPITTSINTLRVSQGIPRGRFIRFSGHSKVYLVIESTATKQVTDTDTTIKIYPQLLHSVQVNEVIYFGTDVKLDGFYDKSVLRGVTYVDGVLADAGEIKLVEAPIKINDNVDTTRQYATTTTKTYAINDVSEDVNFTIQ